MAPHYQAATLIAAPCYPDAIAWSSENLVAVASGHLVTILNPDALEGPRQVIVLRRSDPFPIGVVNREGKVADISQLLFNYYKNINFGEDDVSHLTPQKSVNNDHTEVLGCTRELQEPLSRRGPGRRRIKSSRDAGYIYDDNEDDSHAVKDADFSLEPCSNKSKKRPLGKVVNHGQGRSQDTKAPLSSNEASKSLPHITAKQYAYRDALLSSLIVAWSPVLSSSDRVSYLSRDWCILAVGSKSGNVSFWKVCKPEYYTIDVGLVSREPMLIGVLQTHKSWVSAISLEVSSASSSKSSLLLATGCSDGSVKIWSGDIEGLHLFKGAGEVPFVLVAEITADVSAPVSSISLSASAQLQPEVNLAIGRVSGSLETWMWNACSNEIENTSACHAHDQVVTGLSWGLDGHCLYSCSQDNSVRCWITQGKNLEQIPMHTYFPEIKESTDLSEVSDRCFGLTLAPGQQMIAVVRSLDSNLLNPMYEARTQKAVVEFTWIGGQFLGIPIDQSIYAGSPESPILSSTNLWWGSNILWSLKKYETGERALVLWDVIAALQGLKKSAPAFLGTLMHKWVSDLFSDDSHHVSFNGPSHWRGDMMCKVSSRNLHLLNIICRKVMLKDNEQEPGAENFNATDFWNDLLASSERELRERLVSFTFGVVLKRTSCILSGTSVENSWFPVGVAQMDSWVSMNDGELHNQLSSLRCRIQDPGSRTDSVCEYSVVEACTYCSAPVPFESADVAACSGNNPAERHMMSRCKASMRLCSVLQPVWHCVCCGGMVEKLLPESFFTMPASPLDADGDDSIDMSAPAVPLCPFCGVLLQRSMPEFLLSASPV
ncbi:hypothetical protein PR202_ga09981 [Eleusine coracana subsp. coracana]|uniref:Transcription factor IIIC 90kDa subunit N-terminal domain-containing protein n=1 Tax=Eleusine coracana subsp. coracana TaxID=191504 RepID=A0AAV5C4H3_ELECO|nr:hypothetical protein PR202_ga09981 [Eleusine coracana subsp. coracana]